MGLEELMRIDTFLRKEMQRTEHELGLCDEDEHAYAFWMGRYRLIQELLPLLGEIDGEIAAQEREFEKSEKDCMWEAD